MPLKLSLLPSTSLPSSTSKRWVADVRLLMAVQSTGLLPLLHPRSVLACGDKEVASRSDPRGSSPIAGAMSPGVQGISGQAPAVASRPWVLGLIYNTAALFGRAHGPSAVRARCSLEFRKSDSGDLHICLHLLISPRPRLFLCDHPGQSHTPGPVVQASQATGTCSDRAGTEASDSFVLTHKQANLMLFSASPSLLGSRCLGLDCRPAAMKFIRGSWLSKHHVP